MGSWGRTGICSVEPALGQCAPQTRSDSLPGETSFLALSLEAETIAFQLGRLACYFKSKRPHLQAICSSSWEQVATLPLVLGDRQSVWSALQPPDSPLQFCPAWWLLFEDKIHSWNVVRFGQWEAFKSQERGIQTFSLLPLCFRVVPAVGHGSLLQLSQRLSPCLTWPFRLTQYCSPCFLQSWSAPARLPASWVVCHVVPLHFWPFL